jgi:O-succinylbenzoate synthase
MKETDPQLRALLKRWGEIEPKPNFETNVWRQIRQVKAARPERVSLPELLRGWVWQPAMAFAVVMAVGAVIGSSAGVLSTRRPATVAPSELQFLGSGTLAGSYVNRNTGGGR